MIKMIRDTTGFTLIELLVVIAIISILSSVVLASLSSARMKGRDARRVSDVKQIQLALELYYDNHSFYPTNGYAALVTALSGTPGDQYISQTPNDPNGPASNNSYGYHATPAGCNNGASKCTGYYVGAIMESIGQVGSLSSDNDIDTGANVGLIIDGAALTNYSCSENAGGANERLYCASSL